MSWEFKEDFTRTEPVSMGKPPNVSGPYHVRVGTTEMTETSNGNDRVRWTNTVLDGPFKGCEIFDGINLPNLETEKKNKFIRSLWMNLLLSLGNDKKKLKKKLKISPKLMEGKDGYINYTTKEDAGDDYGEVQWITKGQYNKLDTPEAPPAGVELEDDSDDEVDDVDDDSDVDDDDLDPLDDL